MDMFDCTADTLREMRKIHAKTKSDILQGGVLPQSELMRRIDAIYMDVENKHIQKELFADRKYSGELLVCIKRLLGEGKSEEQIFHILCQKKIFKGMVARIRARFMSSMEEYRDRVLDELALHGFSVLNLN